MKALKLVLLSSLVFAGLTAAAADCPMVAAGQLLDANAAAAKARVASSLGTGTPSAPAPINTNGSSSGVTNH